MKPHPALRSHVNALDSYQPSGQINFFQTKKIRKQKTVPPPAEEDCTRLNAMARAYPFCIYYREKSNDPL
jgi:hypothetical protein